MLARAFAAGVITVAVFAAASTGQSADPGTDQWALAASKNLIDFVANGFQVVAVLAEPGAARTRFYYAQKGSELVQCVERYVGGSAEEVIAAINSGKTRAQLDAPRLLSSCYRLTAPQPRQLPQ